MEDNSWYESVVKEIGSLKEKMKGDRANLRQLDILLELSKKIAAFSSDCSKCSNLKMQITDVINDLSDWPDTTDEQNDNYIYTAKSAATHITRIHNLTTRIIWFFLMVVGAALFGWGSIWARSDPTSIRPIVPSLFGALIFISGLIRVIIHYSLIFYYKRKKRKS